VAKHRRRKERRSSSPAAAADKVRRHTTARAAKLRLQSDSSDSSSDDDIYDEQPRNKGKKLLSGRVTTADNVVRKRAPWPHTPLFQPNGKPSKYEELYMPQFVMGYTIVMEEQKAPLRARMAAHLIQLMKDATKYQWEDIRSYHSIWLQHIESGRAKWKDAHIAQELRQDFMFNSNKASRAPAKADFKPRTYRDTPAPSQSFNAPPGTTACSQFQHKKCQHKDTHGQSHHICAFCLKMTRKMYNHPEADCHKKATLMKDLSGEKN
jgi:hypothetical protein